MLYWATQFGSGYGSNACSCPIIVDDFLYVYAGTNIYKIDKTSGEALVTKSMAASSSFAINSPTYADGMIFVGLSNGRIQAFDAVTLDSLWLFTDSNGGQPNCPIVYHDGYIYTGFGRAKQAMQVSYAFRQRTKIPMLATKQSMLPGDMFQRAASIGPAHMCAMNLFSLTLMTAKAATPTATQG